MIYLFEIISEYSSETSYLIIILISDTRQLNVHTCHSHRYGRLYTIVVVRGITSDFAATSSTCPTNERWLSSPNCRRRVRACVRACEHSHAPTLTPRRHRCVERCSERLHKITRCKHMLIHTRTQTHTHLACCSQTICSAIRCPMQFRSERLSVCALFLCVRITCFAAW